MTWHTFNLLYSLNTCGNILIIQSYLNFIATVIYSFAQCMYMYMLYNAWTLHLSLIHCCHVWLEAKGILLLCTCYKTIKLNLI